MSCTEFRVGRVREVVPDAVGFEGKVRALAAELEVEPNTLLDYKDDYEEEYLEYDCGYEWVNGKIYQIVSDRDFEDADICEAEQNADGTISYRLKFYNGGTCFSEMLSEAITRMEAKKEGS